MEKKDLVTRSCFEMMTESIVFFIMTTGIGGEVLTYLRMAEWLYQNTNLKIYCADLPNGAVLSYIKKQGYDYINIIRMNVSQNKDGSAVKKHCFIVVT